MFFKVIRVVVGLGWLINKIIMLKYGFLGFVKEGIREVMNYVYLLELGEDCNCLVF